MTLSFQEDYNHVLNNASGLSKQIREHPVDAGDEITPPPCAPSVMLSNILEIGLNTKVETKHLLSEIPINDHPQELHLG